jgi:hypothetical protein
VIGLGVRNGGASAEDRQKQTVTNSQGH